MPKIVDHEFRREAVAEVVWRIIARDGIQSVTIRRIAAEAGCSTGVLVHYFRNKDELLLYVLRLATLRAARRMEKRIEKENDKEALRGILQEALPLDKERRLEWQIWVSFWGRAVNDPMLAGEQKRRYLEWRSFIRDLIRDGQEKDIYRKDVDAPKEADAVIAIIDGIGVQATLEPRRLPATRQIEIIDRYLSTMLQQ